MGIIRIALEDERGRVEQEVRGDTHAVDKYLPDDGETSYHSLRFVDLYGDTVFNRLQMAEFIEEWGRIQVRVETPEERQVFDEVLALARRCQEGPHLYLRFYGD